LGRAQLDGSKKELTKEERGKQGDSLKVPQRGDNACSGD